MMITCLIICPPCFLHVAVAVGGGVVIASPFVVAVAVGGSVVVASPFVVVVVGGGVVIWITVLDVVVDRVFVFVCGRHFKILHYALKSKIYLDLTMGN